VKFFREVIEKSRIETDGMLLVSLDSRPVVIVVKGEANVVGKTNLGDVDLEKAVGGKPKRVVQAAAPLPLG
jgi:hypothetical protein